MNKIHFTTLPLGQPYDSAFSASLALRFNACQQLAHATGCIEGK